MKKRLQKLSEFRMQAFTGKRPCLPTLRKMCATGQLPAEQINGHWYVDVNAYNAGHHGQQAAITSVVNAVLGAA